MKDEYWDWKDDTHYVKQGEYYGLPALFIAGGDDE